MPQISSGGFTSRSDKTESFIRAVEATILTPNRYIKVPTGIEHRFGDEASKVHQLLYNSTGPTTDLLRYFPDALYLDRFRTLPTWDNERTRPEVLDKSADEDTTGLFTFFVEFKHSDSRRKRGLGGVPAENVGILEREAWLTYKRLCNPNPQYGIYLDGQRTRIALFLAATYAPHVLYGCWEHELEPINRSSAIRKEPAKPGVRAVDSSTGSGTPWINFDIRQLKPLPKFASEDLYWSPKEAELAVGVCLEVLALAQP